MKNLNSVSYGTRKLLQTLLVCLAGLMSLRAQAQISAAGGSEGQLAPQSSGHIIFHGQAPGNTDYGRLDPLDVCPNTVPSGYVIGQPYRFEFDTECLGNYYNMSRPPFIWTIKYLTESGRIYEEQWWDQTLDDYSKPLFYLYDRVPVGGNNNQAANTGNTNLSRNPAGSFNNTAQPGDVIYGVRLECTGYSCKVTDDNDAITLRYYNRRPDALTVTGSAPLCRNLAYPISATPVVGASRYRWTATSGATVSSTFTTSPNATLNLTGVPAGVGSITVRVAAVDESHCGATAAAPQVSATRDLTLSLAASPSSPQNLTLSNGRCPTSGSDTKTASITAGPRGTYYSWTVSGAGATILGTTEGTDLTSVSLTTPQAGTVTVSVKAKTSDCGGYSAALTQTFQIGNIVLVAPSGYTKMDGYCAAANWCYDHSNKLVLNNPQPGLNYFMSISDVLPTEVPNAQTTVYQYPGEEATGYINLGSERVRSFRLNVSTVNPCPASGSPTFNFTSFDIVLPPGQPINGDARSSSLVAGTTAAQEGSSRHTLLYPNPTTGTVSIGQQENVHYQWVKIIDAQGRTVTEVHATAAAGITSFDLKNLPAGLYQVHLFNGKQIVRERVIKQ